MVAMTAGCTFQYGLAYLIPAFRHEGLFTLHQATPASQSSPRSR
jgi:hypothetical protein